MSFETLLLDVEDRVARLILNRPDAGNAMNAVMMRELRDAAIRCDEDPEIRAVIIAGAGKMFCAGGDLRSFAAEGEGLPAYLKGITNDLHGALSRLARMDAPVVSAVQGSAAGAGLSLACAADMVIAAESARFTVAYTNVGLVPDGSCTFFLPRLVGLRRAQEMMLTRRVLGASEALDWHLVTRVVPDGELQEESSKLAAQLAAGPTRAFGAVKRLLLHSAGDHLESQMEQEARAIADAARGADGKEGIAAFLEKRAAEFIGE
jgi:2-(1,2-epoxy-1,2-dihydrophenyl)acetyl-CoA isomerase